MISVVKTAYQHLIAGRNREIQFCILMAFLPTFVIARAVVYLDLPIFVVVNGTHIHHMTYGIIILAISGYMGLTVRKQYWRPWIAVVYGIGLALAFDEIGMWLSLRDSYWVRQSYDVMLVILALLVIAIGFSDFWQRLERQFLRKTVAVT